MHEQFIEIPRPAFASLIADLSGGRPREDDPGPYHPSEELVRALWAFIHRRPKPNWAREVLAAGNPVPWRTSAPVRLPVAVVELLVQIAGPHPEPWDQTELNPQPLPPRFSDALSVAAEVADKVILLHELAKTLPEQERTQASEFAAHQLSQFVRSVDDDRCPLWWWMRQPLPWPRSGRDDLINTITPVEVIVMGAQFENAAATAPSEALRESLAAAGQELMNLGLLRLEVPAGEAVVA